MTPRGLGYDISFQRQAEPVLSGVSPVPHLVSVSSLVPVTAICSSCHTNSSDDILCSCNALCGFSGAFT
jgi:hypothetical protein